MRPWDQARLADDLLASVQASRVTASFNYTTDVPTVAEPPAELPRSVESHPHGMIGEDEVPAWKACHCFHVIG